MGCWLQVGVLTQVGLHAGLTSEGAVREVEVLGMLLPNDTSGTTSKGGSGVVSATGTDCMFLLANDPTFMTLSEMVHPDTIGPLNS